MTRKRLKLVREVVWTTVANGVHAFSPKKKNPQQFNASIAILVSEPGCTVTAIAKGGHASECDYDDYTFDRMRERRGMRVR